MSKRLITRITIAATALGIATAALAQMKPEQQIETRQAGYTFMAWNMGKIKANLDGTYDKAQVQSAAGVIAAIAGSGMGALYGPGTDKNIGHVHTHVKPELFQNKEEVAKVAGEFGAATKKLVEAAAGDDVGAVKTAFGDVGAACKSCHDKFREKM